MATWQATTYDFSGAVTTPPAGFGGLTQYSASNNRRGLALDGAGNAIDTLATASGYLSYALLPEPGTEYMIGIRFAHTAVPAANGATNSEHRISFRNTLAISAVTGLVDYGVWSGAGVSGGIAIQKGKTSTPDYDAAVGAAVGVDTWMIAHVRPTPSVANSTRIREMLITAANFNKNDPDAATTYIKDKTIDDVDATLATAAGAAYCGFASMGNPRVPTGWAVQEMVIWVPVVDAEGPQLLGGQVSPDGRKVRARFTDQTLPLAASGGVTGMTVEMRPGFSGGWTIVPLTGDGTILDSAFVELIPTTPIPAGYDVRVSINNGTTNLYDSRPTTPNKAATRTVYCANWSLWTPTARTWTRQRVLGTWGCLGVGWLDGTTGKEAQATREIMLPYGCDASGVTITYEGSSAVGHVTRIMAAGVRAVQPDGTVSTHTLSFGGSGTVDIAQYAVASSAPIATAFLPGTLLYVTTLYKEAAGGLLPFQWAEPISERHTGTYDGPACETGNIGTLTNKVLLGGTAGGPGHTATGLATYAGAQNRSRNYGPMCVRGLPHPNSTRDDRAYIGIGNSLMGDTADAMMGPISRAYFDQDDFLNCAPGVVASVGGGLVGSALTYITTQPGPALVFGSTSADCLVTNCFEWYGANDIRVEGRTNIVQPYGPEALIDRLWSDRTTFAARSQARGITHISGTLSPITDTWLTWPAADKPGVQKARAEYNAQLSTRWASIPGMQGIVQGDLIGGLVGTNTESDAVGSFSDDSQSWMIWEGNDGIHSGQEFESFIGWQARATFDRLYALANATPGGGSGSGNGEPRVTTTTTMTLTTSWQPASTSDCKLQVRQGSRVLTHMGTVAPADDTDNFQVLTDNGTQEKPESYAVGAGATLYFRKISNDEVVKVAVMK